MGASGLGLKVLMKPLSVKDEGLWRKVGTRETQAPPKEAFFFPYALVNTPLSPYGGETVLSKNIQMCRILSFIIYFDFWCSFDPLVSVVEHLFDNGKIWGSERASNLLKATQLGQGSHRIPSRSCSSSHPHPRIQLGLGPCPGPQPRLAGTQQCRKSFPAASEKPFP